MLSLTKRLFRLSTTSNSGKYFKDTHFKNVTAISYDTPGNLSRVCNVFASYGVNLSYVRTHCENRKKDASQGIRYRVDLSIDSHQNQKFQNAKKDLLTMGIELREDEPIQVPWFPRNKDDINKIGHILLEVNQSKEHSQFQDQDYIERRNYIAKVAKEYKMGQPIPSIDYSKAQHELWRGIYNKLQYLHRDSMCERFLSSLNDLQNKLNVSQRIPQLSQLSDYLKEKTGFTIKPTHGILSQRQFLNAFAFKIFCSTQYLRNVKNPDYTPQPDIVHEIVGHVPMFADPEVAELSQTIGLLSLGASDEQVAKLGSLYWFTLEFGVCKEKGKVKGYGAGVASSIGQIQNFMCRGETKPKFQTFDVFRDCTETYPVQTVQPVYKVTQSFQQALKDLDKYGRQIMKPLTTVFNEAQETILYDRHIEAIETEDKGPKF